MNTESTLALLVLEDGSVWRGRGFGDTTTKTGEVVFCTAMTGYEEALTDPSYQGQILVLTATQIGNTGITTEDGESAHPQVAGFVVREATPLVSNCRAKTELPTWLAQSGVPAMEGLDTRALVRRLRESGAMRGAISNDPAQTPESLLAAARAAPDMSGANLAESAGPGAPHLPSEDLGGWWDGARDMPMDRARGNDHPYRVVALDCGAKRTIYKHLVDRGCEVHALPANSSPSEIRALEPEGLFVSNGPGDPAAVDQAIDTLREVAGEVPTFGICLGHQLLSLALGAQTTKMKFGHRGANQPVHAAGRDRIEITSQNHGFCVEAASLEAAGCSITHRHVNDGTVAGFRHDSRPIFAVQYHPEASPGPHDSAYLFDDFVAQMADARG
ncbi:MAG: glutamine-hydrolyzing carbamoyl-phosphate synthase small subunit [Planctomycetota bacterium]|nr:glutamine-hydrolyzing carbamoyl-phosphate synthase small subunit [Planctomycetota bacterium]